METGYVAAFWFLVISAMVAPLMLGAGALLRTKKHGKLKETPYECGEEPIGSAWIQFNIRFYVIAIIFLIFDVEVATVFPAAVLYRDAIANGTGLLAFAKIFLFIALLALGLIFSWCRGDLEWVKSVGRSVRKVRTHG